MIRDLWSIFGCNLSQNTLQRGAQQRLQVEDLSAVERRLDAVLELNDVLESAENDDGDLLDNRVAVARAVLDGLHESLVRGAAQVALSSVDSFGRREKLLDDRLEVLAQAVRLNVRRVLVVGWSNQVHGCYCDAR